MRSDWPRGVFAWQYKKNSGGDIKMFCSSHANHPSTNSKKVLSWKTQQVYFIYLFSHQLKLEKSLETCCIHFFFAWADIVSEKNPMLESIFFAKQRLVMHTCTCVVYKTSQLVRICLLINALNTKVLLFFSGKLSVSKQ